MDPLVSRMPRPLEDAWASILDAVLAEMRAPRLADVAKLAPKLVALSRAYNAGVAGANDAPALPLEARIAFSFARDVPKATGAVRELVALDGIDTQRPLRILDLGAGLGAMTWGIVRALPAKTRVTSLLVDDDAKALAAAASIARHASKALLDPRSLDVRIETKTARLQRGLGLGRFDLVVLGQVLSELDLGDLARVDAHAELLRDLYENALDEGGSIVVVEPALRDRTRHLHAVRDRVLALTDATLVAPCLHREACPALASEGDWCHEDLSVDLPEWVVPLARAAGLRWQGLTFSYFVLRRRGPSLRTHVGEGFHLRVVSDRFVTKGKTELFGCTNEGERRRLRLLDRDRAEANAAWDTLARGDVARISGDDGVDDRGRVSSNAAVDARAITKL